MAVNNYRIDILKWFTSVFFLKNIHTQAGGYDLLEDTLLSDP